MPPRHHRIVLWAFAAVVLVWMAAQTLLGCDTGLLYVAPALVLALPLVLGRYLGEEQIAGLRQRRAPGWRRTRGARVAPRTVARAMQRGGRLVASSLAKRPPPAAVPVLAP